MTVTRIIALVCLGIGILNLMSPDPGWFWWLWSGVAALTALLSGHGGGFSDWDFFGGDDGDGRFVEVTRSAGTRERAALLGRLRSEPVRSQGLMRVLRLPLLKRKDCRLLDHTFVDHDGSSNRLVLTPSVATCQDGR